MGTAVISDRFIIENASANGRGATERIFVSSLGAGSPTNIQSQLSVVLGVQVTINKVGGTAPKAGFGGTKATRVFTAAANPSDGDTVTIGTLSSSGLGTSKVYRFKDTIAQANDVLIGVAATNSLDNLIAAVNGGAGSGTLYHAGTTAHPDVEAAAGAGDTIDFSARAVGAKYNQIPTTETGAQISLAGATLTGGVDQNVVSIGFTSAADDNAPVTLDVHGIR